MTAQPERDVADTLLQAVRHEIANHLVVLNAGLELAEQDLERGTQLAAQSVRRVRDVLAQRAEHPLAGTARHQRAVWVLHMLLGACHDLDAEEGDGIVTFTARGRLRQPLVGWAHAEADLLDGTLDVGDGAARLSLPR